MKPASLSAEGKGLPRTARRANSARCGRLEGQLEGPRPAAEAWDFMRSQKFFGMIIPKKYGGRGFFRIPPIRRSWRLLSTVSVFVAGVTRHFCCPIRSDRASCWSSFGAAGAARIPGCRGLADGLRDPHVLGPPRRMPLGRRCHEDEGVVGYGESRGKKVLDIRLNFEKRYINARNCRDGDGAGVQAARPRKPCSAAGVERGNHGGAFAHEARRASAHGGPPTYRCSRNFQKPVRSTANDVLQSPLDWILGGPRAGPARLDDA